MDKLIETIDSYVKKVPALPENIKEMIVKFAPWIAIITIVISAPALLSLFGFSSYMHTMGMGRYVYSTLGTGYVIRYRLMQVFLVANLVLRGLSIPGLFARSTKGWMFMFYSVLLYAGYSVVTFDIVGGILSTIISLYFLFQVRSYYQK